MLKNIVFSALALVSTMSVAQLPINDIDSGKITANKGKLSLLGQPVNVGQQAPAFKAANNRFAPIKLSDFANQAVLISVVPSLDTGICSIQTKHFNDKMAANYPNVKMLTISMDLPFAQKRFCDTENVNNIEVLSDSVWREFAANYGLLIQDMGLLARAVFVLDKQHTVVYKQLVDNLAKEPNYKEVESILTKL